MLPVSTHKAARLRSSRGDEADEWCKAPEVRRYPYTVLHQKAVCASRGLQSVLSLASSSCQARVNHAQGRSGARWPVEEDSGQVVMYSGVSGWWHGGTGGSWAPYDDIMVSIEGID